MYRLGEAFLWQGLLGSFHVSAHSSDRCCHTCPGAGETPVAVAPASLTSWEQLDSHFISSSTFCVQANRNTFTARWCLGKAHYFRRSKTWFPACLSRVAFYKVRSGSEGRKSVIPSPIPLSESECPTDTQNHSKPCWFIFDQGSHSISKPDWLNGTNILQYYRL